MWSRHSMMMFNLGVILLAVVLSVMGTRPSYANSADNLGKPHALTQSQSLRDALLSTNRKMSCDIGLVTDVGHINDGTFNQYTYEGLVRAQNDFDLQLRYIESNRPSNYEPNLRQLANEGCRMIFAVGFIMSDVLRTVASDYPGTKFAIIDSRIDPPLDNVRGTAFNLYDSGYLAGFLAGMMTASNTIGVVAGPVIPPVTQYRDGFEDGALASNSQITVLVEHINSFNDPAAGAAAALAMVTQGTDIIFGIAGRTGAGAITAAAQAGAWVIGVSIDEYYTTFQGGSRPGSDRLLTSAVLRVDNAAYYTVRDMIDGSFSGGNVVYDITTDGVGLAPFHGAAGSVPQDITDSLAAVVNTAKIVTATIGPGGGALVSTDGNVRIEIPPVALASTLDFTYAPQPEEHVSSHASVNRFFEVVAEEANASSKQANGVTDVSYNLTIRYSNAEIDQLTESSLSVHWWSGIQWTRIPSQVNTSTNTVTASVAQYGRFAVLGAAGRLYFPLVAMPAMVSDSRRNDAIPSLPLSFIPNMGQQRAQ